MCCQKADRNFRDLDMIINKLIIQIIKNVCSSISGMNLQIQSDRNPVSTFLLPAIKSHQVSPASLFGTQETGLMNPQLSSEDVSHFLWKAVWGFAAQDCWGADDIDGQETSWCWGKVETALAHLGQRQSCPISLELQLCMGMPDAEHPPCPGQRCWYCKKTVG